MTPEELHRYKNWKMADELFRMVEAEPDNRYFWYDLKSMAISGTSENRAAVLDVITPARVLFLRAIADQPKHVCGDFARPIFANLDQWCLNQMHVKLETYATVGKLWPRMEKAAKYKLGHHPRPPSSGKPYYG